MLAFMALLEEPENRDKVITIYRNYYSYMAGTAAKYLNNPCDVEDTVHDCMVRLMDIIDKIELSDSLRLKNLCGVVARNIAINRAKLRDNNNCELDIMFNMSDNIDTPEEILIKKDTLSVLVKAIDSLSDNYKDVCRLKYINQLKEREIAKLLDLPPKTVNQRIFRGKRLLRKALSEVK